jgi:hypothetical protein
MARFVCRLTVLTAVAASCLSAWAAPINLNPNLNLSLNPGSTGIWTLSATNQDNGVAANNWNAFGIALQIIPDAGATGTVTLQSFINPIENPSVATGSAVPPFIGSGTFPEPINGTTDFTGIVLGYSGSASPNVTNWPSGQTHNMATITWSASPDASGTWRIFASNPEDDGATFPQTTWNLPNANDRFFGNVPFIEGQTSTLQLGTISVVPEPHGLIVAGSAAMAALTGHQLRLRRRRNRMGGKQELSV